METSLISVSDPQTLIPDRAPSSVPFEPPTSSTVGEEAYPRTFVTLSSVSQPLDDNISKLPPNEFDAQQDFVVMGDQLSFIVPKANQVFSVTPISS